MLYYQVTINNFYLRLYFSENTNFNSKIEIHFEEKSSQNALNTIKNLLELNKIIESITLERTNSKSKSPPSFSERINENELNK